MAYDWPGNVRELERLMERAVALTDSDVVELDDLPPAICGDYGAALWPSVRRNDSLRAWASRYTRLVLDRCAGNKAEACRALDISYHTLQAYLRFPVHSPAVREQDAWDVDGPAQTREAESAV
jgi:transcriptional regulator with AAA-type ATPase domain